jgi:hypothetical protein
VVGRSGASGGSNLAGRHAATIAWRVRSSSPTKTIRWKPPPREELSSSRTPWTLAWAASSTSSPSRPAPRSGIASVLTPMRPAVSTARPAASCTLLVAAGASPTFVARNIFSDGAALPPAPVVSTLTSSGPTGSPASECQSPPPPTALLAPAASPSRVLPIGTTSASTGSLHGSSVTATAISTSNIEPRTSTTSSPASRSVTRPPPAAPRAAHRSDPRLRPPGVGVKESGCAVGGRRVVSRCRHGDLTTRPHSAGTVRELCECCPWSPWPAPRDPPPSQVASRSRGPSAASASSAASSGSRRRPSSRAASKPSSPSTARADAAAASRSATSGW